MRESFFRDVVTSSHPTSAGPCDLPILYRDASLFVAIWRIDAERARASVGDAPFEPWLLLGKAIAMLCVFEYRDTTIGPYGEVGVGVLVKRPGTRPSWVRAARDIRREEDAGFYVVSLPVTEARACAAGRELWGYPKYVTTMESSFGERDARVKLGEELELTLPLGKGRGVATAPVPIVTYSVTPGGRVARTTVDVDFRARWGGARRFETKILGQGPTTDAFQALGLDRAAPVVAFRADPMRSILPLGVDMGPAPAPASKPPAERGAAEGAREDATP